MLYLSLFLAGFTLGIFAALKIFNPERQEESWDPQHFPLQNKIYLNKKLLINKKTFSILPKKQIPVSSAGS